MSDPPSGPATYEGYIGRWSRIVAAAFVTWLEVPARSVWFDVACGTGALTNAIVASCDPARVDASDPDEERVAFARRAIADARVTFAVGDATRIAVAEETYDVVVAGLAFPSIGETAGALAEFLRIVKRGGKVGAYVWDFDGEMQLLRYFWAAAAEVEPGVDDDDDDDDDDERYAICEPEGLRAAWLAAGLSGVDVHAIDARADFTNFDDFWSPFQVGDLPAQTFVRSLDAQRRALLRERLRERLPIRADGSFTLTIRAWAAKGTK